MEEQVCIIVKLCRSFASQDTSFNATIRYQISATPCTVFLMYFQWGLAFPGFAWVGLFGFVNDKQTSK